MSALRHRPGQIVVFTSEPFADIGGLGYLTAYGEIASEKDFSRPASADPNAAGERKAVRRYLYLLRVGRGEEERMLDLLHRQNGVIAASRNYVAESADDPADGYPEAALDIDVIELRTVHYYAPASDAAIREYESLDEFLKNVHTKPCRFVASVDVNRTHAKAVLGAIQKGYSSVSMLDCGFIAFSAHANTSTITDLYGVTSRLLTLSRLAAQRGWSLAAINLSIDFSMVIRGYGEADPTLIESPDAIYSIPLFERVLEEVLTELAEVDPGSRGKGHPGPPVFAASGNRRSRGATVRLRLGYPAVRPETIAVTFTTNPDEYRGSDTGDSSQSDPKALPFKGFVRELMQAGDATPSVLATQFDMWMEENPRSPLPRLTPGFCTDRPATSALKPCIAILESEFSSGERYGSSFASAWVAGRYAAETAVTPEPDRLGMLGRLAWLSTKSAPRQMVEVQSPKDGRLPTYVHQFPPPLVGEWKATNSNELEVLLGRVANETGVDAALYGSTAFVGAFLSIHEKTFCQLDPTASAYLGDVDVVRCGVATPGEVDAASKMIEIWLFSQLKRAWLADGKRPIHVNSLEGLVGGRERLTAQTPVARIVATRGGFLDTMQGLRDLHSGEIGFLGLDDPKAWRRCAATVSPASCPAIAILRWISTIALLRIVAASLRVPPPEPRRESLGAVEALLASSLRAEEFFGGSRRDLRERVDRRLDRSFELLAVCGRLGAPAPELDALHGRMTTLRRAQGAQAGFSANLTAGPVSTPPVWYASGVDSTLAELFDAREDKQQTYQKWLEAQARAALLSDKPLH